MVMFLDVKEGQRTEFQAMATAKQLQSLPPAERLFHAVENDEKMALRHCLEIEKIDINARNADGDSVAHYLAKRSTKLGQMRHVYRLGADFSAKGCFGVTPLLAVCEFPTSFFEKVETVKWILSVAPNTLEEPDDDGLTPFLAACQTGQLKIVRLLIDLGANRFAKTSQGHNASFLCTMFGHLHVLSTLVMEYGFEVKGEDVFGRTCLHWAAYHDQVQECAFLRRLGLSPLATDNEGRTPLHWAAIKGSSTCVSALCMGTGMQALSMRDKDNRTPLALAGSHGKYTPVFKALRSPRLYGNMVYERAMLFASVIILVLCVASWVMMTSSPVPWFVMVYFSVFELIIVFSLGKSVFADGGSINVDHDLSTSPVRLAAGEMDRFAPATDPFPVCYTCNTRRVLRSKHSSVTNRCIARFDHYCPYVSNDVGLGNQVYFVMFLWSVTMTTGAGLFLFYDRLFVTGFPSEMKSQDMAWADKAMVALAEQPVLFAMFVLDIGVVLAVGALFVSLASHAIHNMSTNEAINWHKYKHFIDTAQSRFHNPFNRGLITNIREYFGIERLPSGGFGRRVHWRTCVDLASYQQLRETLDRGSGTPSVATTGAISRYRDIEENNPDTHANDPEDQKAI